MDHPSSQTRQNAGNAPAAIKIHDEQPGNGGRAADKVGGGARGDLFNSQKVRPEEKLLKAARDTKGKADPLNTVTTLNFKEIR